MAITRTSTIVQEPGEFDNKIITVKTVIGARITRSGSDTIKSIRIWQGNDLIAMSLERAVKLRDALAEHLTEFGL